MSIKAQPSVEPNICRGRIFILAQLLLVLAAELVMLPAMYCQTNEQAEIRSHFQKADADMRSGNRASAEGEFRAILALDPINSEAHAKLGFVLFMQGEWAEAAENLQQALKVRPDLTNAQAVLGMCEVRLGRPEEARRSLQQAFSKLVPGALKIQAGLELAEIFYQSGNLNQAVDIVRVLLPLDPRNADVLYTAARVYSDLANRSRDALILTAPDSGRTHQLMGEFLINTGDTHAAIVEFRKALKLDPSLTGVHYELGEAFLANSREATSLDAAEKEFQTALAEDPSDANAEYQLGTICSLRRDYKAAVDHYTRALQFWPDNAHAQQELGWAWFKLGDTGRGLEHLLAAIRIDPLFPTPHYQLGTIYRQLGREADSHRELAVFEKLENARKEINHVYYRTRPGFQDANPGNSNAPRK